jgi:homoserine O-acetyltransferase
MQKNVIIHHGIITEKGVNLAPVEIAYCTYGTLNAARNNVIYVCHALTANADVADWWPNMVGNGLVFDTSKYFVVCANVLGSCYGTTGANSTNPATGERYGNTFPHITIRDLVKAHQLLVQYLNIHTIHLLCGGSLGGQQALEWSIQQPRAIKNLFLIATNAKHSPWGIAFNEAQRMALSAKEGGLETARAIAMLSYRSYEAYTVTQTDEEDKIDHFRASTYQRYQGEKLKKRFDADCYYTLSKAMDSHNVGRGRGGVEVALSTVKAKTLISGISSDMLFPVQEQKLIAESIPGALFEKIESLYGHDGFLMEAQKISGLLKQHLDI